MRHHSSRPILWCLVAALLFGASTPASKALLGNLGPFSLAGLLYLGAATAVLPSAVRSGLPSSSLLSRNLLRLAGAVFFGGVLGPVLLLRGLLLASAASTALWLDLETVATALLGWGFFREHLHRQGWLAVGLVGVASAILAAPSGFEAGPAVLLIASACACWGLDNNLTALIDGFTPAQCTLVKGLVAGGFNLGLGLRFEGELPSATLVASALMVGAFSYGLSLVLYIAGAQQLGAARSQMIFSTAPFWGVAISWALFSEPVFRVQAIAGALMLVALWLMRSERHEHQHRHETVKHLHWHRHDDGHHEHAHLGRPSRFGHSHEHTHEPIGHAHPHRPDLQHRHSH